MPREPIPSHYFALSVVRRDDQFLMVRERRHGALWYFPGGGVKAGETLAEAAVRETREEAGMHVRLTGIYRIEHTPSAACARVRAIFGAEAIDDRPPKQSPDHHSLGAGWFTLAEVASLPLRGPEVLRLLCDITSGALLHPLALLATEGEPLSLPTR